MIQKISGKTISFVSIHVTSFMITSPDQLIFKEDNKTASEKPLRGYEEAEELNEQTGSLMRRLYNVWKRIAFRGDRKNLEN